MGKDSAIEWTHHTFNPWWGCEKVSAECTNCYAEASDRRYGGEHWGKNTGRRFFGDKHWNEPLKWHADAVAAGQRRRVFCASMSDVFEDRDDLQPQRLRLYALIDRTPQLDWLLLTKRPDVARREFRRLGWRPNIWAGTSVGCTETRWRLAELAHIDQPVRFVSAEPLLEVVDFRSVPVPVPDGVGATSCRHDAWKLDALAGVLYCPFCGVFEDQPYGAIDWVIGGGESGSSNRVRPMDLVAARTLRDQCADARVPFLLKQWGQFVPAGQAIEVHGPAAGLFCSDGTPLYRVRKKKDAGRTLDGVVWDGYPTPRTEPAHA